MPEEKSVTVGSVLSGLAVLVCSLALWVQLLHEREHDGSNYVPVVLSLMLYVVSLTLVALAFFRNLKDSTRAKGLIAQIDSIKDDFDLRTTEAEKLFHEELERKDKLHDLEVRRLESFRDADREELRIQKTRVGEERKATPEAKPEFSPLQRELVRLGRGLRKLISDVGPGPTFVVDHDNTDSTELEKRLLTFNQLLFGWGEQISARYELEFSESVETCRLSIVAMGLEGDAQFQADLWSLQAIPSRGVQTADDVHHMVQALYRLFICLDNQPVEN